jgi:adenylate cyclase class 2
MLLRLRDALDTHLTLKAPAPSGAQSDQHKARVEIEITVNDYDAAFAILTALGYSPAWRYEKYRESFRLDDVIVALDHTPIGDFVEIEGPPDAIRPVAERLGFDWTARNLQTYRELFNAAGLTDRTDMVFLD